MNSTLITLFPVWRRLFLTGVGLERFGWVQASLIGFNRIGLKLS